MSAGMRLKNPTLIPELADNYSDNFPFIEPPKVSERSSLHSPPISHQSSRTSTIARPSYHSIVEEHISFLVEAIKPYVRPIVTEDKHLINEYSLGSSIGHGQFGKAYKAYSNTTRALFAIKVIPKKPWNNQQYSVNQTMRQIQLWKSRGLVNSITGDEAIKLMNVQKCRWEIFIMCKLSSPYVAMLRECLDSSSSKSIYIVNEWCNLGELKWKRRNKREVHPQWEKVSPGCDTLTFAKKALNDLTHGLHYLKSQGCIHRDIKPSNILVDGTRGSLKISDFGCSLFTPEVLPFADDLFRSCFKSELNKIVGTPAFIAPELCQFEEQATDNVTDGYKLDMWALGVTMFSLLYNEMPFLGENEFDTYQKTISVSLRARLNGDFFNDLIIERLLNKDAQARINIEELVEIILPKNSNEGQNSGLVKKSRKSVQRLFTKLWTSKKKDSSAKEARPSKNDETISVTEASRNNVQLSRQSSYSACSSSSSSSYEEPVQITGFINPGQIPSSGGSHDSNYDKKQKINANENNAKKTDSVSLLSISPIKIPTPIKALIRIKSSPRGGKAGKKSSTSSPLKDKHKKKGGGKNRLAHSKDITNFQNYIHSNGQDNSSRKDKGFLSTTEDIQEFLKYADDA